MQQPLWKKEQNSKRSGQFPLKKLFRKIEDFLEVLFVFLLGENIGARGIRSARRRENLDKNV